MIEFSKLLYENVKPFLYTINRNSHGAVRAGGGKWADLQKVREGEYFLRKNKEYLDYIKQELKKGRKIEEIIEETRHKIYEKKRGSWNPDED